MDKQTLLGLEYFTLLTYLSGYARTSEGKNACLALRPSCDLPAIRTELRRVSEARVLLDNGDTPPLEDFSDVKPLLRRSAVEGSILNGDELRIVLSFVQLSKRLRSFLLSRKEHVASFLQFVERISALDELISAIEAAIDSHGWVKDSASSRLRSLRMEINSQKQKIHRELNGIMQKPLMRNALQDNIVTLRNDRYVLPVKSGSRHSVPGIVHDFSQSKSTCFIEPWELVEKNNELSMLMAEEHEETARVLRRLSDLVRAYNEPMYANFDALILIDVIFARASMSRFMNALEPELHEDEVCLRNAIHPLLIFRGAKRDESPPVPLDIRIPRHISTIIISGANMGGKTVTLKTLGLLSLMVQSGLHIPVEEGSGIPVFSSIHAVIGDEQDLLADLSSFSSQIKRLTEILNKANAGSLILLDEACTNTDPTEGGALALSVLEHLEHLGAKTLATTHYNPLKVYGLTHEKALNISVEFDEIEQTPTYRLLYGSPGHSNALEIARKLGMPRQVLQRAEDYLSPQERRAVTLVQNLENTYHAVQQEKEKVESLRKSLEDELNRYNKLAEDLEVDKEHILERERQIARSIVKSAEKRFKKALRTVNKHGQKDISEHIQKQRVEFQNTREHLWRQIAGRTKTIHQGAHPLIDVGCRVRLRGSEKIGHVVHKGADGSRVDDFLSAK